MPLRNWDGVNNALKAWDPLCIALPEGTVLGEARNPPDESNVVQSALFIPLSRITETHRGRKIRTTGQILAYDLKTSLLLLAAQPNGSGPLATLLVDLKVPLLDCPNPAITDIPLHDYTYAPPQSTPQSEGLPYRERLRIERGGWVCVVGWLEGEQAKRPKKIDTLGSYAPPSDVILEAIHISNARPPPNGALYRGDQGLMVSSSQLATDDTPRPRARTQNVR